MEISDNLIDLEWIPRPRVTALRRLGIEAVEDLLTHYPRRYEDRQEFAGFPRDESSVPVCICGEIAKTRLLRFGGRKIFEATLEEPEANALSQPITLRWFNVHYVQKMLAADQRVVVFGKPKMRGKRLCIDHPEFEIIENDEEISIHFRRITPIYPATEGVSQRVLRSLMYRVLHELSEEEKLETLAPRKLVTGDRRAALHTIHFPESWEALKRARHHLVLAEFFAIQMLIASRRTEASARVGAAHCGEGRLLANFLKALPFDLTAAQRKVIAEIRHDLARTHPMNRLLQGDVGSGKTVVAVSAMLLAVEAGFQAALMAPTQILAEQHYAVLSRWLEPLGIRVGLRTAARQEESGPLPLFENASQASGVTQAISDGGNGGPGSARVSRVGDGVSAPRTLNPECLGDNATYSRRRLPHFEKPWAIYAVTMATKGRRKLSESARTVVLNAFKHFHRDRYELFVACVMPDHVHLIIQPWPKSDGEEEKSEFWKLTELLKSVKSFSAHAINALEDTSGPVWEKENFDRYIRSDSDLREKYRYILGNPWTAGVAKPNELYRWLWTSDEDTDFESPSRRDDATDTRDACAPRNHSDPRSAISSPTAGMERLVHSNAPHIIIGTHALLYDSVQFENLGLVVIDEQHKFGVAQRARLTAREPAPDVLVMTATPIPRTLTMTVYGDLDVSIIDEMPANRGKIVTAAREETKLGEVLAFIRKQLEAGRQAYVIYPLIEESEKLDVKAAAAEFAQWKERLHPYRCELIHGRIPAPEKQASMERFRRGEAHALISTTVIEVGVDVPNATVMLIENAERFGLAQLHQLRGRIGRGEHKSYCILLSSDRSDETSAKLAVLEKTSNGFEIAEADWDMRGPGDLLGTAQSGLPALKIGSLKEDADLMRQARAAATIIFEKDPQLEWAENQHFRRLVVEQQGRTFSHVS